MANPIRRLPDFVLYGEADGARVDALHIESIAARSRLHDWEIDVHVHRGLHQIVWVHRGHVQALLDESTSRNEGPAAILIPPGVAHAFRFSVDCEGFVLTFDARRLAEGEAGPMAERLLRPFGQPRALALTAPGHAPERLHRLFVALHEHSPGVDPSPVPMWLARALAWELAGQARLQDADQTTGHGHHGLYTRFVGLLEAHFRAHWPVTRYAASLGLSAERLNRIVRAETGAGAQALLHARLAREARRQLVHVAAPISAIAFELGFDDPAYFCRFFKRHVGCTPSHYRSRQDGDPR